MIQKFSAIASVTLPFSQIVHYPNQRHSRKKFSSSLFTKNPTGLEISKSTSHYLYGDNSISFQNPVGLDLENLNLDKKRYSEFQNLGFRTSNQLLERLSSNFYLLPYSLRKQRRQAFFRLGILVNFL